MTSKKETEPRTVTVTWKALIGGCATILGGMAALMTIHTEFIVPPIVDKAIAAARTEWTADLAQHESRAHEDAVSDSELALVLSQFTLSYDAISARLTNIEADMRSLRDKQQ
mgnify:CR=1 FL=1